MGHSWDGVYTLFCHTHQAQAQCGGNMYGSWDGVCTLLCHAHGIHAAGGKYGSNRNGSLMGLGLGTVLPHSSGPGLLW